jgi:hypothetical protein
LIRGEMVAVVAEQGEVDGFLGAPHLGVAHMMNFQPVTRGAQAAKEVTGDNVRAHRMRAPEHALHIFGIK